MWNVPIHLEQFLSMANGQAKTRLFSARDYQYFCETYQTAIESTGPYYEEADAGTVANAYGYAATTAAWGIYRKSTGEIHWEVKRVRANNRHAPCVYYGGERGYHKAYREGQV